MIGLCVMGVASVLCAIASSIDTLITARAVQGIGAALVVPTSLALLNGTLQVPDRARGIGVWAGLSTLATTVGPYAAGWLVDHATLLADPDARTLAARAVAAFANHQPAWRTAAFHSLDLQLAARDEAAVNAGDYLAVVGDIHAGATPFSRDSSHTATPVPTRCSHSTRRPSGPASRSCSSRRARARRRRPQHAGQL